MTSKCCQAVSRATCFAAMMRVVVPRGRSWRACGARGTYSVAVMF